MGLLAFCSLLLRALLQWCRTNLTTRATLPDHVLCSPHLSANSEVPQPRQGAKATSTNSAPTTVQAQPRERLESCQGAQITHLRAVGEFQRLERLKSRQGAQIADRLAETQVQVGQVGQVGQRAKVAHLLTTEKRQPRELG